MGEMNERRQDFDLLQRFVREGEQSAFAELVRRHLNLVFGTALRKVDDAGAAQEISQNVFGALARKAWRFSPEDSLAAWLHKTALLESKSWLRGEMRRRRREETAAQLGTTMNHPEAEPALTTLAPLLDEALLSLRESDRAALLLRYYETRSLREVGAAFGVSEDTAQKRVQSALEKLSSFFRKRGFSTMNAAAAAATLKATSASASTSVFTTVLSGALQSAPPVAGWTLVLGRVAALTKAQIATICLALSMIPATWQWKQAKNAADEEASWGRQLEALQTQQEQLAFELDRLRAESLQLEEARVGTVLTQVNQREALQKWELLKQRTRGLLATEHYRWPEDLPFVRIPKSALPSVRMAGGPTTPAKLEAKIGQLLDLTVAEQEVAASSFSNYFAGIDQIVAANIYETNQATGLKIPPDADSRVFVLEALGPKIRTALEQLCAELKSSLGEDRWALVNPDLFELSHYEQVRLLGYTQYAWDQREEIAVHINSNSTGEPTTSWTTSHGGTSGPLPLRWFLPEASPANPLMELSQMPPALANRIQQWLTAEAAVRSPKPAIK